MHEPRATSFRTDPRSLTVRGLSWSAAGRRVLSGIDLDLAPEGVTVVMGANGAGKSVLLRLLNGLIAPQAGRILWGGEPASSATRRAQALVFQRPVLLRRSVAANVDFVLPRRDAGLREALLAEAGLAGRGRTAARSLSGGEQQRLALARALATRPRVLMLDEPTASLDPAATAAIEATVRRAAQAGVKAIFVTHDTGQARRIADDVVFLAGGRVVEHGAAARFFAAPSAPEARAYLDGRLMKEDPE